MRDSHGGSHFVYVLPAGAARMIYIDADIVVFDFHFVIVLYFGHDFEGAERSVATFVGVERGNAHQTMHAHFRL